MGKQALAIRASDLALPEFWSGIFSESDYGNLLRGRGLDARHPLMYPHHLLERPACETDFDYLQLLPYAALRTRTKDGVQIAAYQRGAGSAEERLHAKWSIGFGGHVDTPPPPGESLTHHLAAELQRELHEEIGLRMSSERLHRLVSNCSYIYLRDTDVDRVHLGLSVTIDVSEGLELVSCEPDQICNLRWMSRGELLVMAQQGQLENWSAIMLEEELV